MFQGWASWSALRDSRIRANPSEDPPGCGDAGGRASRFSGGGVREWLEVAELPRSGVGAAAFDTRIDKPRVPGSAARGAEKRLRRLGFRVVAEAQSFFVTGTKGPLATGEVERARRWAEQVAAQIVARPQRSSPLKPRPFQVGPR